MPSFDTFVTDRLRAERIQEVHLQDLMLMDRDPRVMDPLGGTRTREETQNYLQRNLDHWDAYGYGLWMLWSRETGQLVGRAYVRQLHINGSDEVAIGYALVPAFWGKGLATEIATKVVDVARSVPGLNSVTIAARPDNVASIRVIEKIGGRFEAEVTYKDAPHRLYRILL